MSIGARRATQPRYNVSFRVRCSWEGQEFDGTCRNLSVGGMYLETPKNLNRDSELHLKFCLPVVDEKIEVDGKVRWKKSQGFRHAAGIQFFSPTNPRGLKPQHLWALNTFFKKPSN